MRGRHPRPTHHCRPVPADPGIAHVPSCLPLRVGLSVFASADATPGAKQLLIRTLLQCLVHSDPAWKAFSMEQAMLHKSPLGKPLLFLKDEPGPSLSFTHGGGRIWAAMSTKGSVGVDVAYPEEFFGDYPFARAFRAEEMEWAETLCRDPRRGAALLWSAKESSVKALGTGFHSFDPLEVQVGAPLLQHRGILVHVSAGRPLAVWTIPEGNGWLSLAFALPNLTFDGAAARMDRASRSL